MKCWNCNHDVITGSKFCTACGESLEKMHQGETNRFCPQCGQEREGKENFCTDCGYHYAGKDTSTYIAAASEQVDHSTFQSNAHPSNQATSYANINSTYAAFGQRVGASIIDFLILFAFMFIFSLLFLMYTSDLAAQFWGLIIGLGYKAGMESSKYQGTLGKLAMGIKVTDDHGQRISFARAMGRYFASYISAFILGIGYLLALFTAKKQTIHDMIAGTVVHKK
ncbi:RDD family protein [Oceanobacillus salinisoli]|uniref:RDD family protein n=1 Tax=Oceanobacillus salinisoli TaxID=2678611 RepID=UPI001E5BA127|nr:RDD family protein [Oceanobacillus salinisoli]